MPMLGMVADTAILALGGRGRRIVTWRLAETTQRVQGQPELI
jgi:hypothetical protein